RGELAAARESLTAAARLRSRLTYAMPTISVQALLDLGRTYLCLADPTKARDVLRQATDILRLRPSLGTLPAEAGKLRSALDMLQARAASTSSLTPAEL